MNSRDPNLASASAPAALLSVGMLAVWFNPMPICVDFIECCRKLLTGEIGSFRGISDHMEKWLLAFGALRGRLTLKESNTVSKGVGGKSMKADIGAAAAK